METNGKKRSLIPVLIIYSIIFYAVWTLNEFYGKAFVESLCPDSFAAEIVKSIVKLIVWAVPALLLVRHFDSDMRIHLKEMFSLKRGWLTALPFFLFFTVYLGGSAYMRDGKFSISESFGVEEFLKFLVVGLTEEAVFRGWLLNATAHREKPWGAVAVNAVMFLLIHFPIWLKSGEFVQNMTSIGFVFLMALSVLFSYTFLKTKNLLVPIALHMYYDLLCWLFY